MPFLNEEGWILSTLLCAIDPDNRCQTSDEKEAPDYFQHPLFGDRFFHPALPSLRLDLDPCITS
jgi:hypothetical protein